MKTFEILGHDNVALSIAVDSLYQIHGENIHVRIVSNQSESENPYRNTPYEMKQVSIEELFHDQWQPTQGSELLLVAMSPRTRRTIFESFSRSHGVRIEQLSSLIHPDTSIAQTVTIGNGLNMGPRSVIAPFAQIGNAVMISRCASVGHHTVIEEFVTVNPGVTITGSCHIESGVTIGAGATIYDSVRIGAGSFIGAGSLVNKDVPADTVAFGSPARVVRST